MKNSVLIKMALALAFVASLFVGFYLGYKSKETQVKEEALATFDKGLESSHGWTGIVRPFVKKSRVTPVGDVVLFARDAYGVHYAISFESMSSEKKATLVISRNGQVYDQITIEQGQEIPIDDPAFTKNQGYVLLTMVDAGDGDVQFEYLRN